MTKAEKEKHDALMKLADRAQERAAERDLNDVSRVVLWDLFEAPITLFTMEK